MSGFYKPCRLVRSSNVREALLYVRDDITSGLFSDHKVIVLDACVSNHGV